MTYGDASVPVGERPFTDEVFSTAELPDTPTRSFRIPASGWIEAPPRVLELGDDLGEPVEYKRRIHGWLLWRAGPPVGRARYLAIAGDGTMVEFELDGRLGNGTGADGEIHTRFRTWKESLRDNPGAASSA